MNKPRQIPARVGDMVIAPIGKDFGSSGFYVREPHSDLDHNVGCYISEALPWEGLPDGSLIDHTYPIRWAAWHVGSVVNLLEPT